MRGVVIGGTHSGCGKTTVTMGILAALKERGYRVQAFKTGPDFIDPGLHRLIIKRPSRNLDLWMCGEEYVRDCFYKHSRDADISVVEGVMGLYDGEFSTAKLAMVLNLPIILVVDAYGIAESVEAVVRGFVEYRNPCPSSVSTLKENNFPSRITNNGHGSRIIGVIFNRVASENHYIRLKNSVSDIPVLGYLPRDLKFEIPHRHLGLMVAEENPIPQENIEKLTDAVLRYIDVDLIGRSSEFRSRSDYCSGTSNPELKTQNSKLIKVAVAYDKAFCFYYEDNLDLLKEAGAEIVRFSPLSDFSIPEGVNALYLS